jgi:hypothetical protein
LHAAGYHYLSTHPNKLDGKPPPINGVITILCAIMWEIVSSAAEAKLGALFHNGKEACPICVALEEMGHPQALTPIVTNNSTTSSIANDTINLSKAMDMRFYWVCDHVRQGQFHIKWEWFDGDPCMECRQACLLCQVVC